MRRNPSIKLQIDPEAHFGAAYRQRRNPQSAGAVWTTAPLAKRSCSLILIVHCVRPTAQLEKIAEIFWYSIGQRRFLEGTVIGKSINEDATCS